MDNKGTSETEFSVSKRRSFLYPDFKAVEFMLKRFVTKEMFNKNLYAVYVFELPFNKDITLDRMSRHISLGVYLLNFSDGSISKYL